MYPSLTLGGGIGLGYTNQIQLLGADSSPVHIFMDPSNKETERLFPYCHRNSSHPSAALVVLHTENIWKISFFLPGLGGQDLNLGSLFARILSGSSQPILEFLGCSG